MSSATKSKTAPAAELSLRARIKIDYSQPIPEEIKVEFPGPPGFTGGVMMVANPLYVVTRFDAPAWLRMQRLASSHRKIKTTLDNACRGLPLIERTRSSAHTIMLQTAIMMHMLVPDVQAEATSEVRRITGKENPTRADFRRCLLTQCGLSYEEVKTIPLEEEVELLRALPNGPTTHDVPRKPRGGSKPKSDLATDAKMAEQWESAKPTGTTRKEFAASLARDRENPQTAYVRVRKCLDRHRKRRK